LTSQTGGDLVCGQPAASCDGGSAAEKKTEGEPGPLKPGPSRRKRRGPGKEQHESPSDTGGSRSPRGGGDAPGSWEPDSRFEEGMARWASERRTRFGGPASPDGGQRAGRRPGETMG
ncbi:hypothetical protein THAOC_01972, partial [Thalassiosira oceanica]